MRDRSAWLESLAKELAPHWPRDPGQWRPSRMCEIELGLYLIEQLLPGHPAIAGWTLLGGYPFATALGRTDSPEQQQMVRVARHYLWSLRRRRVWQRALESYAQFDSELRGYQLADPADQPRRRYPVVAADRRKIFEETLRRAPGFTQRRPLPIAEPGPHRFPTRTLWSSVDIPGQLPAEPAASHDLDTLPAGRGRPLEVPLTELRETAFWMDEQLRRAGERSGRWSARIGRIEIELLDTTRNIYRASGCLSIDRLLHLVGMVGAGKSTLRDVLAVWAARQGLRTTLIVGDVAEQLSLVNLFRTLGLRAAPVLGSSTRERNVQRLHRRLATAHAPTLLAHDSPSFDFLSTACPLDALRGIEATRPLRFADAPCTSLYPIHTTPPPRQDPEFADLFAAPEPQPAEDGQRADEPEHGPRCGCSLWTQCPRHEASRRLVDADIWVANPASLIHSPIPQHQNDDRIRYLELACRRSDLIIVDEADRVQMQLDAMFAPAATLAGRTPESWLDELHGHKIDELAGQARIQLSDRDVERWSAALSVVTTATDRLYAMLVTQPDLREWVGADYFSAWTLQQTIVTVDWYPLPAELRGHTEDDDLGDAIPHDEHEDAYGRDMPANPPIDDPGAERREQVTAWLDRFRDDPLGDRDEQDRQVADLIRITSELLHTVNESRTYQKLTAKLVELSGMASLEQEHDNARHAGTPLSRTQVQDIKARLDTATRRFAFTLILAVLHHRLDLLTDMWQRVDAALNLDYNSNQLSRRPPQDYGPLVPEAPMGNILGFQFLRDERPADTDGNHSGVLRFFRCAGVGRSLLLNLPDLVTADDRPAPHVLMMSGTSWAGTAVGAHLLVQVGAILKPPQHELDAIRRTVFRTLFIKDPNDPKTRALHLSGTNPRLRPVVLEQILHHLARPAGGQRISPIEDELNQIQDPDRRRILLLVGSYDEARRAFAILDSIKRWTGKVCRLVSDDTDLDDLWQPSAAPHTSIPSRAADVLRRGDVAAFAETGAQLLIAPLMAIERGHNILNANGHAAIGSVFFLARPHPRPNEISLAVQSINSWVTRYLDEGFGDMVRSARSLDEAGLAFRRTARREWRHLLTRKLAFQALNDDEKEAFTWDRLVVIWQVIGRLVRGGVPARVVFVDAKFAERAANDMGADTFRTGLLEAMKHVLRPYIDTHPSKRSDQCQLVQTLYDPLYQALVDMPTPGAQPHVPTGTR